MRPSVSAASEQMPPASSRCLAPRHPRLSSSSHSCNKSSNPFTSVTSNTSHTTTTATTPAYAWLDDSFAMSSFMYPSEDTTMTTAPMQHPNNTFDFLNLYVLSMDYYYYHCHCIAIIIVITNPTTAQHTLYVALLNILPKLSAILI